MLDLLLQLKQSYSMSANELVVFICLISSEQNGSFITTTSNQEIMAKTQLSRSAVKDCIKVLHQKRLIDNRPRLNSRKIVIHKEAILLYTGINLNTILSSEGSPIQGSPIQGSPIQELRSSLQGSNDLRSSLQGSNDLRSSLQGSNDQELRSNDLRSNDLRSNDQELRSNDLRSNDQELRSNDLRSNDLRSSLQGSNDQELRSNDQELRSNDLRSNDQRSCGLANGITPPAMSVTPRFLHVYDFMLKEVSHTLYRGLKNYEQFVLTHPLKRNVKKLRSLFRFPLLTPFERSFLDPQSPSGTPLYAPLNEEISQRAFVHSCLNTEKIWGEENEKQSKDWEWEGLKNLQGVQKSQSLKKPPPIKLSPRFGAEISIKDPFYAKKEEFADPKPLLEKNAPERFLKTPERSLTPNGKEPLIDTLKNNNVYSIYSINIYHIYYYCANKRNSINQKYFMKEETQKLTLVKAKEISKAIKVAYDLCAKDGVTLTQSLIEKVIDQKYSIFDHKIYSRSNLFAYFYVPTLLKPQKILEHITSLGDKPKDPWYRSIKIAMQNETNSGGDGRGMHHQEKKNMQKANELAGESAYNYYSSVYHMRED